MVDQIIDAGYQNVFIRGILKVRIRALSFRVECRPCIINLRTVCIGVCRLMVVLALWMGGEERTDHNIARSDCSVWRSFWVPAYGKGSRLIGCRLQVGLQLVVRPTRSLMCLWLVAWSSQQRAPLCRSSLESIIAISSGQYSNISN